MTTLAPILTPHGRLLLEPADDAPALPSDLSHRLQEAFARGSGHGLLHLGAAEVGTALPPAFGYWREFGARYVSAVCGHDDLGTGRTHTPIPAPPPRELEMLAAAAPPMLGAEYLTPPVLEALWNDLGAAFQSELAESKTSLQDFLRRKSPAWNLVGRVHFNLAENRHDAETPFAFLATYTTRLSAHATAQHLSLGRALTEYAGAANRSRLLWIEVDRAKLGRMLDEFRAVEHVAKENGLDFVEAMRLLAGARVSGDAVDAASAEWSRVVAGPWLAKTLEGLRRPEALARIDPGDALKTTLRPYQRAGVRWLHLLSALGLGACLADDMGLGKTMQVLALLLVLRRENHERRRRTSLIVAPASLVANWESEVARFAPSLRTLIAHPSVMPSADLHALDSSRLADVDLVITSYGTLVRTPALVTIPWELAVLDEAQAIKNPGAKQTRAAKQVDARARIALTGTPVENRIGDLWSIFDFINSGLLGTGTEFARFTKRLAASPPHTYGPLRDLVRPYILSGSMNDRSCCSCSGVWTSRISLPRLIPASTPPRTKRAAGTPACGPPGRDRWRRRSSIPAICRRSSASRWLSLSLHRCQRLGGREPCAPTPPAPYLLPTAQASAVGTPGRSPSPLRLRSGPHRLARKRRPVRQHGLPRIALPSRLG